MSNTAYPDGVAAAGGAPSPTVPGTPVFHPPGGHPNVDYRVSSSDPATPPATFNGLEGAIAHAQSLLQHSALRHTRVLEVPTTLPLTVTIGETLHAPVPKPPVHHPPPPPAR